MAVLTREDFRTRGEQAIARTETIAVPELGEDAELVIKGYGAAESASIQQACIEYDEEGKPHHDAKQDMLLSVIAAVHEPQLTLEDAAWIATLPCGVVDRILATAGKLSGRTQSSFDAFKVYLRQNPYMRRLYSACARYLKRLPSELGDITEAEFNLLMAALELDAEDDRAALEDASEG